MAMSQRELKALMADAKRSCKSYPTCGKKSLSEQLTKDAGAMSYTDTDLCASQESLEIQSKLAEANANEKLLMLAQEKDRDERDRDGTSPFEGPRCYEACKKLEERHEELLSERKRADSWIQGITESCLSVSTSCE